jgi:branched-chain amino acid aminotransferase
VSPPCEKILHGISLATAVEIAGELGIPFRQRDVTVDDVTTSDEVLLTSTSLCILPVTAFNGQRIANGTPGNVFASMLAAWSKRVGLDIAAQAEQFAQRSPDRLTAEQVGEK